MIDSGAWNKYIHVNMSRGHDQCWFSFYFYGEDDQIVGNGEYKVTDSTDIQIPENSKYLVITSLSKYSNTVVRLWIYELNIGMSPKIEYNPPYVRLTKNGFIDPVTSVNIDYDSTSAQKFYRLDSSADWINYTSSLENIPIDTVVEAMSISSGGYNSNIVNTQLATESGYYNVDAKTYNNDLTDS